MKAIEKLKAAAGVTERRSMHSDALDMVVFAKPLSMGARDKINKHVEKSGGGMSMFVYAIIFCLESEDGDNLFSLEDKKVLMEQIDSAEIRKLGEFIYSESEKN